LLGGWELTAIAITLLSLGVGATTAAFSLVNRVMPHSAPYVTCATMIGYSGDPSSAFAADLPSADELQGRISDAYATGAESAGDAVGSMSDMAEGLGERPVAALVSAAALALLVTCTRGAARLLSRPGGPTMAWGAAVGAALGAMCVATLLLGTIGLPAIGLRAIAFALAVSLLAVRFARDARSIPAQVRV
jgi:hypothetical protein